jgi:archaeoflavoprotein AfpA
VSQSQTELKKRKVAWGISGAGDRITEYVETMKKIQEKYADIVEIQVFASKAGETVLKYYNLEAQVKQAFPKYIVEVNANAPFLAAWMQLRKYEFLIVAPGSSNTVAKIAYGIGDTMLTNAVSMSLKAFAQVYIAPVDLEEKTLVTKLPNGKDMKLRVRKEDAENVQKLRQMDGLHIIADPKEIHDVFAEWFAKK